MTHKLTVHYAPGTPVSDFDLEELYQYTLTELQQGNVILTCPNELFFHRIRVGVREGDIPHENVTLIWREQEFIPDKNGRLDRWPPGFLDNVDRLLERLL